MTTSQQVNAINYKYMASKRKCKEFGIDGTIENSMVDYYDCGSSTIPSSASRI